MSGHPGTCACVCAVSCACKRSFRCVQGSSLRTTQLTFFLSRTKTQNKRSTRPREASSSDFVRIRSAANIHARIHTHSSATRRTISAIGESVMWKVEALDVTARTRPVLSAARSTGLDPSVVPGAEVVLGGQRVALGGQGVLFEVIF